MVKETRVPSILVVEDEPRLMELIAEALAGPYKVSLAYDCKAAKELLASGEKFDLVLTDFQMPHGNGDDVARAARAVGVPRVVLFSGLPGLANHTLYDRILSKGNGLNLEDLENFE